jgi:hypothetical protein
MADNPHVSRSGWSIEEDETLKEIVLADKSAVHSWARIAEKLQEKEVGPKELASNVVHVG